MASLKYKDPVTGEVITVGTGGGSGSGSDVNINEIMEQVDERISEQVDESISEVLSDVVTMDQVNAAITEALKGVTAEYKIKANSTNFDGFSDTVDGKIAYVKFKFNSFGSRSSDFEVKPVYNIGYQYEIIFSNPYDSGSNKCYFYNSSDPSGFSNSLMGDLKITDTQFTVSNLTANVKTTGVYNSELIAYEIYYT